MLYHELCSTRQHVTQLRDEYPNGDLFLILSFLSYILLTHLLTYLITSSIGASPRAHPPCASLLCQRWLEIDQAPLCVRWPRCHNCRLQAIRARGGQAAFVPEKWHTRPTTRDQPELRGRACVAQHEPRGRAAPLFYGRRTTLARAAQLRTANAYLYHNDLLGQQLEAQIPRRPQSLAARVKGGCSAS